MVTPRAAAVWTPVALALAGGGCSGCREDHPYVPYAIASGAPGPAGSTTATASAASALPEASAPPPGEAAQVAPPGLSRWELDGVTLQAPEGQAFVAAVVCDFDGDGTKDAFAIARPEGGADPGALSYYRGGDGALRASDTFAPAPGLATDPGCAPVGRLVRVGARTVLVELGVSCAARTSSAPARWIALVAAPATGRPAVPAGVRLGLTIADPPGAPALSVDADAADRDGDGLPDVALRATLEGGGAPFEPGPRVGATLTWLDRPAGLSRDVAATEASFVELASQASMRGRRAKEAATVPALVAQARALYRALCTEGGAPRLAGVVGTGPIACGAARALEELGLAEVRAQATLGDPVRAALALDRAQRAPAARTASRAKDAQGWLARLLPASTAKTVRSVAAVPLGDPGRTPTWGPLTFEPSGKLLVRTRAGVVRVDPDAGDEADADGVAPWSPAVTSPDGRLRWSDAYDACDGVSLHATFALVNGEPDRDLALPVAPPLGSRCTGPRGAEARVLPIAWGLGGLEALVEDELVLVASDASRASPLAALLDAPAPPGAPRSVDGKALVVPTGAGLVVRAGGKARWLRAPELDGTYGEQHGCVVSSDATHVACVRAARAWVGAWDAP